MEAVDPSQRRLIHHLVGLKYVYVVVKQSHLSMVTNIETTNSFMSLIMKNY